MIILKKIHILLLVMLFTCASGAVHKTDAFLGAVKAAKNAGKVVKIAKSKNTRKAVKKIVGAAKNSNKSAQAKKALTTVLKKRNIRKKLEKADSTVNKAVSFFKNNKKLKKGYFSIRNWKGYPKGPKPKGPFRIIKGGKYNKSRNFANRVNARIHRKNPKLKGKHIHEIHPVKFGGSPVKKKNKIVLTPKKHWKYNAFWRKLQHRIEKLAVKK